MIVVLVIMSKMVITMVMMVIRRRKKVKQPKRSRGRPCDTWSILKEILMAMIQLVVIVIVIVPSEAPFI